MVKKERKLCNDSSCVSTGYRNWNCHGKDNRRNVIKFRTSPLWAFRIKALDTILTIVMKQTRISCFGQQPVEERESPFAKLHPFIHGNWSQRAFQGIRIERAFTIFVFANNSCFFSIQKIILTNGLIVLSVSASILRSWK